MNSKTHKKEPLQRPNLEYAEDLYSLYNEDPSQIDPSWRWFFKGVESVTNTPSQVSSSGIKKELGVFQLIQAYRDHGNLKAQLDPLKLTATSNFPSLKDFGISEEDLDKEFAITKEIFGEMLPLKKHIEFLENTYCKTITLQVGGCPPQVRDWFFNEFENKSFILSLEEKRKALYDLIHTESLDHFLHFHFLGKKRFSIEGLDTLLPMLEYLLEKNTSLEAKELIIGMAHRGRINVLTLFMKKEPHVLFFELEEKKIRSAKNLSDTEAFTGDVKYHIGFSSERKTKNGLCGLHLGFNPSHLEVINPITCGMARALQRKNKDTTRRKTVVPIMIHGDAAFCGQGSASETLQLSKLKGYTVGGTIHIILNNQIGFTTDSQDGRSTPFSSDLAKSIQAPVLLVNADDTENCLKAMDMALRFRHKFGSDVFIDLIGYRRHGHNEGDEPSFTQPIMYQKIKKHPTAPQIYKDQLIQEGLVTQEEILKESQSIEKKWENSLEKLKDPEMFITKRNFRGQKQIDKSEYEDLLLKQTQTSQQNVEEVLNLLTQEPSFISLHPKIKKLIKKRKQLSEQNTLDWALCELLAYGTLIKEGFSVRVSGQDSIRGTFSHRHASYFDNQTNEKFSPLSELAKKNKKEFCIYNSPLSELAVLGFEYGNSCMASDFLTVWEAQFGDFVNGAQIIIDQFLVSGESKWLQNTDLTLFLPHGYEGQGPEHSSGNLERFLQLCAQDNIQVCSFTHPANLFHALRRQMTYKKRKPLIIMTPKSLLRHPEMISTKEEIYNGQFREVIWDQEIKDPKKITTAILCSGKIFYDLKKYKLNANEKDLDQVATFRIEQLYPFPKSKLNPILNGFPCLQKILWVQEEPKNRGSWTYIKPLLENLLKDIGQNSIPVQYVGRPPMAATSEGSLALHQKEQESILKKALISSKTS